MWVRRASLTLVLLAVIGCTSAPEASAPPASPGDTVSPTGVVTETATAAPEPVISPSGPFSVAEVVLATTGGADVTVHVHVAADPATRAQGLMHREDVPPGTGMLFVFPGDSTSGFWMKNTLVPLSIAFVAEDGHVLRILDMDPCAADPCPVYDPETSYRMALEMPLGDFERLGVSEGDQMMVPEDLPVAR